VFFEVVGEFLGVWSVVDEGAGHGCAFGVGVAVDVEFEAWLCYEAYAVGVGVDVLFPVVCVGGYGD